MSKSILITFIVSSNCILSSQKIAHTPVEKPDQIKITPLYIPDPEYFKQDPIIPEKIKQFNDIQEPPPEKPKNNLLILPAEWILESSMNNAPKLLKGIFFYLQSLSRITDRSQHSMTVPSFHRFILVGPPGSGKTTLAHAIAHMLGYATVFTPATGLLGHFKNDTAIHIQNFLRQHSSDGLKKVIIIDELHKLFEHHANERSDDSQSAAAFWLVLDDIEMRNPNVIFIGTANNVDKLPPEIKSRFSGKIITMPTPTKKQKIQAFRDSITHDQSIILDISVDDAFITKMIQQIQNCSFRDVKLIIDTAKMFKYAEKSSHQMNFPIVLTRKHFQQALNQLQVESHMLQETVLIRFCKALEPWGSVLSAAANISILIKTLYELLQNPPTSWWKQQSGLPKKNY